MIINFLISVIIIIIIPNHKIKEVQLVFAAGIDHSLLPFIEAMLLGVVRVDCFSFHS